MTVRKAFAVLRGEACPSDALAGLWRVSNANLAAGAGGDGDGGGAHGLNERIRVKSLYDARDFLYVLVKDYANAK